MQFSSRQGFSIPGPQPSRAAVSALLLVAVDKKGGGAGTAFVADEPRMYFVSVESDGLEWSFTVEERIN
jgi:hypothetical protein